LEISRLAVDEVRLELRGVDGGGGRRGVRTDLREGKGGGGRQWRLQDQGRRRRWKGLNVEQRDGERNARKEGDNPASQ